MTAMRRRVLGAAALCAAAALTANAGDAKKITFTTKSDEARQQAQEAVRRIESFQQAAQIQEAAKKAIAADPDFAWGHYLLAAATFPPPQAKPEHEKALELAAKASPAEQKYLAAMKLNREQKGKEALESFKQLREEYPDERLVHMMVGQLSLNQGQLDEAQKSFERAIAIDDTTPRAHAFIGNVLMMRGEYAQARAKYDAALAKRAPGTAPGGVFYPRSLSYLYEGNVDQALAGLKAFLGEYKQNKLDANFPEVFIWNSIARINLENGRVDEAMKAYQEGFKSVPGSTLEENEKKVWLGRLHHGTGRTLARMGKHEEAWKEAETIKKMIDEGGEEGKQYVPAYHYMAGYLKLESGDAKAAIEHLKQADQNDPFHKLLLARAYEKAGDKPAAKKAYEEIVAFRINNLERALAYPEAKKKLASL
jgi:tetratricopeptide (TPR) repeat protein